MRRWHKSKYSGGRDSYEQECANDRTVKRSKAFRRFFTLLLAVDVLATPNTSLFYRCLGAGVLLVIIIIISIVISGRKRYLKDSYLKF